MPGKSHVEAGCIKPAQLLALARDSVKTGPRVFSFRATFRASGWAAVPWPSACKSGMLHLSSPAEPRAALQARIGQAGRCLAQPRAAKCERPLHARGTKRLVAEYGLYLRELRQTFGRGRKVATGARGLSGREPKPQRQGPVHPQHGVVLDSADRRAEPLQSHRRDLVDHDLR
jgi:hypothetical protein